MNQCSLTEQPNVERVLTSPLHFGVGQVSRNCLSLLWMGGTYPRLYKNGKYIRNRRTAWQIGLDDNAVLKWNNNIFRVRVLVLAIVEFSLQLL